MYALPLAQSSFEPDYRHIIDAATNHRAARLPLYDHAIDAGVLQQLAGCDVAAMIASDDYADVLEGYRRFCNVVIALGYDVLPMECCVTNMIQGGDALRGHAGAILHSREEVEAYDWDDVARRFIAKYDVRYRALAAALPPGLKAIGGIGNGMFEIIQDCVPLMELPFLMMNDPEGYALLWRRIGDLLMTLWTWLLENHADAFAVCRFGDDLGFRSSTMLNPADIRQHILPQYQRIVATIHLHNKPFLLHSCGCIFEVMDDLITQVGIDAKHSNEDAIAPWSDWLDRYNQRIGLFGGIDMDLLCRAAPDEITERTLEVCERTRSARGMAIGCGNSIADYVPVESFLAMNLAVRRWRGDEGI